MRVVARLIGVGGAVLVTMLVLFVAIPDGNDVALTHVDKQQRLRSISGPKMVFVGGSNLMYGLSAEDIERHLGVSTVNMGLNGYLGPRFLMNEVVDAMKPGDTVVLSFEYEAYFEPTPYNSLEGVGADHLMLIKLRPASVKYLETWTQYWNTALALVRVVQAKIFRVIDEGKDRLVGRTVPDDPDLFLAEHIETRRGFNSHGDLVSHIGVEWRYAFWDDLRLAELRRSDELLELICSFTSKMRSRGVKVLLAPPPAPAEWYERNGPYIEDLFHAIAGGGECMPKVLGSAADYVWPQKLFFDNINHLGGEGRSFRTERITTYLRSALNDVPSVIVQSMDR